MSAMARTDLEKYLRPDTLFGVKFEVYLNEIKQRHIIINKSVNHHAMVKEN